MYGDITRLMIGTEAIRTYPIVLRGKTYEIQTSHFVHNDGSKTRVWNAYHNANRIRCFTASEERKFPKTLAQFAENIVRAEQSLA